MWQLGSLTLKDLILDELRMRGAHLIPESSYQPDTRGQTCRRSSHEGGVVGGAEAKGGASEMRAGSPNGSEDVGLRHLIYS